MGKSCVRFKRVEDLALDVIGEVIRRVPAKKYLEHYAAVMRGMEERPNKRSQASKPAKKVGGNRARKSG
jgi:hypothetical protein